MEGGREGGREERERRYKRSLWFIVWIEDDRRWGEYESQ